MQSNSTAVSWDAWLGVGSAVVKVAPSVGSRARGWWSIYTASLTAGAQAFLLFAIFEALRCYGPTEIRRLYVKRRYSEVRRAPPKPRLVPFAWVGHIFGWGSKDLYPHHLSLDTYVYLRVLRACITFFTLASLFSFALLIVYTTSGDGNNLSGLQVTTVSNIKDGDPAHSLWATVGSLYFMTITLWLFLLSTWRDFARHRRWFLKHGDVKVPRAFQLSVRAEAVPHLMRSERKLKDYFEDIYEDQIESVSIVKHIGKLRRAVAARHAAIINVENYMARKQDIKRHVVDELRVALDTSDALATTLYKEAHHVNLNEYEGLYGPDVNKSFGRASGTAFVTFKTLYAKASACTSQLEGGMKMYPANHPNDIIWDHASISAQEKSRRTLLTWLVLLSMALAWGVIIVSIQAWFNIDLNETEWAANFRKNSPALFAVLSKYLPIVATKAVMTGIPFALIPVGHHLIKFKSRTELDHWVFHWNLMFKIAYLWFFVFGVSLFVGLESLLAKPSTTITTLAAAVPETSGFFMGYVVISIVGLFIELIQLPQLLLYPLRFVSPPTVRQLRDRMVPSELVWSRLYPDILLHLTIGLVYGPIAPLINPLLCLYFSISFCIHKYNALYVMEQKHDSGGIYMYTITRALLVCALLAQLLLGAYLPLKTHGVALSTCLLPLGVFLLLGHSYLSRYGQAVKLLPIGEAKQVDHAYQTNALGFEEETIGLVHASEPYTQPSLVKSRWTQLIAYEKPDNDMGHVQPISREPLGIPPTSERGFTHQRSRSMFSSAY